MTEWFSEEELDRISEFANSPGYMRKPTMLLPEGAEETEEPEESTSDEDPSASDDSEDSPVR